MKQIVDEHGNPIGDKGESNEDLNLPPGVQALIETRLNSAVDRLRELNQSDLNTLASSVSKKWRLLAVVSFVAFVLSLTWNVFSWFVAPQQIKGWVRDTVQQRMTEPTLKEAADQAIRDKMGKYVDEKIKPLTEQAGTVAKRIEDLSTDLEKKQDQLRVDQDAVRRQVRVQELALAAKGGGMSEYLELKTLASSNCEVQAQASVALGDVNSYFDVDRASLVYRTLLDPVSGSDPGYSIEELVAELRNGSSWAREAAANGLHDRNRKSTVEDMCDVLEQEKDLRVVARITRAMVKVTGERFAPLERDAVLSWWRKHGKDKDYQSPYGPYIRAAGYMNRRGLSEADLDEAIRLLGETIERDTDALHARCLRGVFLVYRGRLEDAEKEFKEVESRDKNFRWLLFWKPLLYLGENKIDAAAESLNKALEKSPGLESYARVMIAYQPLLTNTNIVWPSASKLKM